MDEKFNAIYQKVRDIIDQLTNLSAHGNNNEHITPTLDIDGNTIPDLEETCIDIQANIDDLFNQSITYWNESVSDLIRKINEEIKPEGSEEKISDIHDAAFDFNNQYVSPNPNLQGTSYRDARYDEIESVLKNPHNLDYTADKPDPNSGIDDLNRYMTRLIMPQYSRRVEIEDLNRNFWVIGQNLSILNNMVLNERYSPWKSMIQEIVDLWENVYRIWQVILYLAEKIGEIEEQITEMSKQLSKTKVQLSYGWTWSADPITAFGDNTGFNSIGERLLEKIEDYTQEVMEKIGIDTEPTGSISNPYWLKIKEESKESLILYQEDSKYLGLLPLLEKAEIDYEDGTKSHVCYLPYNKNV